MLLLVVAMHNETWPSGLRRLDCLNAADARRVWQGERRSRARVVSLGIVWLCISQLQSVLLLLPLHNETKLF